MLLVPLHCGALLSGEIGSVVAVLAGDLPPCAEERLSGGTGGGGGGGGGYQLSPLGKAAHISLTH
jgi:hypothetical protein